MERNRKRRVYREFVAVRIPSRDRNGKLLSAARRNRWIRRLRQFLLNDVELTGLEEDEVRSHWQGEYDPETGKLRVTQEDCLIVKGFCTPDQLATFRKGGEVLLVQLGTELNQEAVAYETRQGLIVIHLKR